MSLYVCVSLIIWHFYKASTTLLYAAYAEQADAKSVNCELTFLFN